MTTQIFSGILVCLSTGSTAFSGNSDNDVFTTQIAPILQRHCLSCHNSTDHKGDFALQTEVELRESGYVKSGQPQESHLLDVITPGNGKRARMPKNGKPLKQAEIAAIRQWVASGAKWPQGLRLEDPRVDSFDWWSFQPLVHTPVPPSSSSPEEARWIRNPIDVFVLSKQRALGLTHSPEADRRTLIRRLSYDLTGLPPSPDEVAAFVDDRKPLAYERLVERLLASPHYGERWARHWLDVAKYADTCGYDKDKLRPNAWPYRDYVIRSFNADKPYWQFVQEQIAGDVLFPGTADGILGLGFIAAGPWDFIGHVEVPESKIDGKVARHMDRDEMVTNTLNTFCSLTIQCAQCHNHKFDPFTQEHYYSLQSVFAAVDRAERPYDLDPGVERQRRELNDRLKGLQADLKSLDGEIQRAGGPALAKLNQQISALKPQTTVKGKRPEFGYHSQTAANPDTQKWVRVTLNQPVEISRVVLRPCHDDFGNIGAGFGFPVRFRVTPEAPAQKFEPLLDQTMQDFPNPGLSPVEMDGGGVQAVSLLIETTRLADRKGVFIMALAEVQILDQSGRDVAQGATVTSLDTIEAPVRWSRKNLTDGIWPEAADPQAVQALAEFVKKRQTLLTKIRTPERTARRKTLTTEITTAQKAVKELPRGRMVYAAASHFPPQANFKPTQGKPRTVNLLHRGNIQQPLAESQPGRVPLSPDDDWRLPLPDGHSESERRAALARWITDRKHPLTWRSIANRIWQYHFGQGLVDSPNDFGRMGQLPTHPALLDWLALEFRDGGMSGNGQSFKSLHRLIVTSATYRQASSHHTANAEIDSSNQFLWRMNRRRLEAEEIRDSILAVSGSLDRSMNGPGYYLFALEKTAHSPHYEYHKFDHTDIRSHRRTVYRFIVRSQPDPFMTTLDCADSSQSTPKRIETLTSLQALSMLNNRFNLVMAERFAARVKGRNRPFADQIRASVRLVTGRDPTDVEQRAMQSYAEEHGLPNLCRVLFNMSEFVFVD
ncbi:MAG: PSD1 and planctomycete cytochrome C domain-containing protein [Planctomycetaceae bacterium]